MRKSFEVLHTVTWEENENENIILAPGQIVEIEFDDVPNGWPCMIINDEMYDVAFDDEDEFNEFFREVKN